MITRRAATAGLAATFASLTKNGRSQPRNPVSGLDGNGIAPEWTARPFATRLGHDSGLETAIWAFNDERSNVLRIGAGSELRLKLNNETSLPLSLHFQGVRGPNAMDGVGGLTQDRVSPGGSFEYRFTPPDPGTFLIRPCVLDGSAEPLERGLSGLLVVEEETPPPADHDIALLVDDWLLETDGALASFEESRMSDGRLGNHLTVNNRPVPFVQTVDSRANLIRLRLANASNARSMRLRFDGLDAHLAMIDGQPVDALQTVRSSLPFAPGTRYDLLVEVPLPDHPGTLVAEIGSGIPLLRLEANGPVVRREPPALPRRLRNDRLPVTIRMEDAVRKDVVIGSRGPGDWTINGAAGSATAPPLADIKRGTPVVLAFKNESPLPQPLHLHGHAFRVLHARYDGWDPYFLDTVQIPPNRTTRIAFVADNPGRWLLASTVMERFDAGLWTWFEVR